MPEPAIRVVLLPRDTNAQGSVFGGVILSHVDLAGVVEARKHAPKRFVTACMREVSFHEPVYMGDVVSFYTSTVRVGRTSVTVRVSVDADRAEAPGTTVRVTEAEVVYVALGDDGRPVPVRDGA